MAAKLQSQRDDLGLGCFFPIPFIYTLHTPKYLDLGGLCFFDREFTCRTIHRSNVRSSVAHRVVQSSRLIQEHFHHPSRCPLCCTVSLPGTGCHHCSACSLARKRGFQSQVPEDRGSGRVCDLPAATGFKARADSRAPHSSMLTLFTHPLATNMGQIFSHCEWERVAGSQFLLS